MIYLNNTATSYPKPKEVIESVVEYLNKAPSHSARSGIKQDAEGIELVCRQKLARLFNAPDPLRIIFTSGSTEALNLAIKGLDLEGGHVITTQVEHNSVIRPLKTLEQDGKIEITFVECDNWGCIDPVNIEKALEPNTKAIIVNHASNVTGSIIDLKRVSKIAHSNDAIFIVDASQSAGNIGIDVIDSGIDLLAFTGHKSLYGMQGIGGLYIREGIELRPLKTGGTGIFSNILTQPRQIPLYYESGTQNIPGIVSLNTGLDFIFRVGLDEIHDYKSKLVLKMIEQLSQNERIKIYTKTVQNSLSNFCFNIDGMMSDEVSYILESSYNVTVRSGLHCAPLLLNSLGVSPFGTVRASPSYFTAQEEIDVFIDAINEISVMNYGKSFRT